MATDPRSEAPGGLDLAAVRRARERIAPYVEHTPLLHRSTPKAELLLKAECLQGTGAFKLRGAFHRILERPSGCRGVVAHSSGNHAQAVARAARVLGLSALVVMPDDAPAAKRAGCRADGAEVVEVGPDSDLREREARRLTAERGWFLVEPYDDEWVAAGQGTAALELVEDAGGPFDRFYAPVSGGGLMAGCAVVIAALVPEAEIIGVEPEAANDTALSLAAGERREIPPPRTLADGLRTRRPGRVTFPVLQRHVSRIELVSDEELLDAMAWALGEAHLVLEPSGAAALAVALREGRGRCAVLLSGGNVAPEWLAEAVRRLPRA